jgi:hypothetical protein
MTAASSQAHSEAYCFRLPHGFAEMIALRVVDSAIGDADCRRFVLDHFADRGDADLAAEASDRSHRFAIAPMPRRRLHERAIELDEIDADATQIVERVGASAEIVETYLEASLAQTLNISISSPRSTSQIAAILSASIVKNAAGPRGLDRPQKAREGGGNPGVQTSHPYINACASRR